MVASQKAEIDELTNNAQKLLESRPDGERSELQQQQYQQLRIATADLKATFEKVGHPSMLSCWEGCPSSV